MAKQILIVCVVYLRLTTPNHRRRTSRVRIYAWLIFFSRLRLWDTRCVECVARTATHRSMFMQYCKICALHTHTWARWNGKHTHIFVTHTEHHSRYGTGVICIEPAPAPPHYHPPNDHVVHAYGNAIGDGDGGVDCICLSIVSVTFSFSNYGFT